MPTSLPHLFKFFFLWILLFISSNVRANGDYNVSKTHHSLNLGAIVDYSSPSGKEKIVAMKIAIKDFNARLSDCDRPTLRIKDSRQDPFQAASTAKTLIKKNHVRAILGVENWEEAAVIARLGNKTKVPILSLANEIPDWACQRWPFLVNAARNQNAQMKAVAAIVQTWQWRRVVVIYEDIHSFITGIIPYLTAAVKEVGSEIHELLALPPFKSPYPSNYYSLSDKLESLNNSQCRVFIVHTSLRLATNLFMKAKSMGMMGKEFVWITTTEISNQVNSLNASVISSMQGVLGVKTYVSRTGIKYEDFRSKFKVMFKKRYPKVTYKAPGIFALQAYDALWAVALANTKNCSNSADNSYPMKSAMGHQLLERILESQFEGLSGQFHFVNGTLAPANIFQIVNVVGKSYIEVGYWSEGLGFSDYIGEGTKHNKSMKVLGQVFWPGRPSSVPRGWALPTTAKPLIIGVPANTTFREFVKVEYYNNDSSKNFTVTGFSIDVFNAILEHLPYNLPHIFSPFPGTYDNLIQEVQANKKFDAVVGDTSIVSNRCAYADFSQPYSESGLQILVYVKHEKHEKAWLFKKPFTTGMWALTVAVTVYNGFVVWLIERRHNPGFRGTFWNQIGTMISLSFVTLFTIQGANLHSNLSRMTMIVWLFVALIITQSYTASLSSLLTTQRLSPVTVDVETLRKSGAKVGCNANSFVVNYLKDVLHFHPNNIIQVHSEEEYSQALINKSIAAAFLRIPHIKVFLAQYNCSKGFATSGPTYNVGGFGFVFPKGSPMLSDISEAVLNVSEKGILQRLEASLLSSYNCSASSSDDNHDNLGVSSFLGLFVITFVTSTIAFLLFILRRARQIWTVGGMVLEMKNSLTSMFRALKQIHY